MASEEKPHHRRAHYAGKYPKKYEEKYKEHQPEKYADTVEHVISKGSTPSGMHLPICVDEILGFFDVQPGQQGIDATLGYGGHAREILKALDGKGHLYALDIDPIESEKTKERLRAQGYREEILTVLHQNFAALDQVIEKYGPMDFILADLGVSSMQIDDPSRGFSYKADGPLDLRMNPEEGETAAQRMVDMSKQEFESMLRGNADEPYASKIADSVYAYLRKGGEIATTTELRERIQDALSFLPEKEQKEAVKKSCQRTFQALRMDVNDEEESLYAFLTKLPEALKPGGKAAILSFHSGEDRLVKKAFKEGVKTGAYSEISKDVIRPTPEECRRNPRAASAKLRWAVKA